jgi:(E)-4-hydroxy-3-methyl-but-2-enyl pyrophosphate reductase
MSENTPHSGGPVIKVAKNAGFCFGVKRAVDSVFDVINKYKYIYTLGELIHNKNVIAELAQKGVHIVSGVSEIPKRDSTLVIVRSHGLPRCVFGQIEEGGFELLDLTCPFVKRIHDKVKDTKRSHVIIVGKEDHPEVIGIRGWAAGDVTVVNSAGEAKRITGIDDALVVAQTTITKQIFNEVTDVLGKKIANLEIFDSICDTTEKRQSEAEALSKESDVVLVIGGKNSSNTEKLYTLCKKNCENTYYIENIDELPLENIRLDDIISIVAGASTPDWLIREVRTLMTEVEKKGTQQGSEDVTQEVTPDTAQAMEEEAKSAVAAEGGETIESNIEAESSEDSDIEEAVLSNEEADSEVGAEASAKEEEAAPAQAGMEEEAAPAEDSAVVMEAALADDGEETEEAEPAEIIVETEEAAAPAAIIGETEEAEPAEDIGETEKAAEADSIVETEEKAAPAAIIGETEEEAPAEIIGETEEEAPAESGEEKESVQAAAESSEDNDFLSQLEKTFVYIKKGQIVTGSVVQISDSEICVNIGYKSDGIIKKENLSSKGDANPQELFSLGDSIEAEVVSLNDGEGNVVLSRKSIESKLKWKELTENLDEEKIYKTKVDKVVKGGVLARLDGYDAFIPASQLSLKYVEDLNEFVGQEFEVKVIEVDKRQRRFVLSHKAVLQKEQEEVEKELYASFQKGDKILGKVKRLTDFGAFVDVGGVDGLLHITDISWVRVKHPSDVLKNGQDIEVLVLNVDLEKKKISLGLKQLMPKPWDQAPEKYLVGSEVEGTVVRILPFGAFVSLEPTIDGLVHISQITNRRLEKVEEVLHVGDEVKAKILGVDPAKKRITLSIRALLPEEEKPEYKKTFKSEGSYDYEIPPVEDAMTTLADFFPKMDVDVDEDD